MASSYPPLDRSWSDIWRDAYVSAVQCGTPEALAMASSQSHAKQQDGTSIAHAAALCQHRSASFLVLLSDCPDIASLVLTEHYHMEQLPQPQLEDGGMKQVTAALKHSAVI